MNPLKALWPLDHRPPATNQWCLRAPPEPFEHLPGLEASEGSVALPNTPHSDKARFALDPDSQKLGPSTIIWSPQHKIQGQSKFNHTKHGGRAGTPNLPHLNWLRPWICVLGSVQDF